MEDLGLPPANWDYWEDIPKAKLWEAVALSLNFEPHKVHWEPGYGADYRRSPEEFRDRLKKASACANKTLRVVRTDPYSSSGERVVKLSEFREWAESLHQPWSLPARFPKSAATAAPSHCESKTERQDRRLQACEAAGLVMPPSPVGRMPNGIGELADAEGVSRQAFTADVKAALERKATAKREGTA
jgi:hypothetical protein